MTKPTPAQRNALLAAVDNEGVLSAGITTKLLEGLPELWARTEPSSDAEKAPRRLITPEGRAALAPNGNFKLLERTNPVTGGVPGTNYAANQSLSRDGLVVFLDEDGHPIGREDHRPGQCHESPYITERGRKLVGMPLQAPKLPDHLRLTTARPTQAVWCRPGQTDALVQVDSWPFTDGTVRVTDLTRRINDVWSSNARVPVSELFPQPTASPAPKGSTTMATPYQKPELDETLTELRRNVAAWSRNADRAMSSERMGKGIAWDIRRLEQRDDLALSMVDSFRALDAAMSAHHGVMDCSPAPWRVTPLTDEQFAEVLRDLPELAVFGPVLARQLSDHYGIRHVRYLAQTAMKNARRTVAEEVAPVLTEGDVLRAALGALGYSVYADEERGFTWLVVPLDPDTAEADMYDGLHFRISSGERADRPATEHDEPWGAGLHNSEADHILTLDAAPDGLTLAEESAHCARAIAQYAASR